ncbi:helix-turn-helix domain-containing protein [Kiloniella laminariae]|uniref:Helix-turn-helix domain-containing protein n=1 Tax=Kiloniella laminariae TaxID=454162 RepID=A0ABT4LHB0_9PROT|nr:helix-turn-helix domain-containing protein [Kiloniella laminariae]MCZ4279387.1 helix-turn-helix domain-containing protein [Kiloniella laminariae]
MKNMVNIAVLSYPGAMKSAHYGLFEFFEVANTLANEHPGSNWPFFRCSTRSALPDVPGMSPELGTEYKMTADSGAEGADDNIFDIVVLPPRTAEIDWAMRAGNCRRWLKFQHQKGAVMASACAGAFLLADAGLLDGRRVTTHWGLAEEFRKRYPKAFLCEQELLLDEGDIITAGGMMAWMDLALRLVEKFASPFLSLLLGKYFLVDTGQRDQRCYQSFSPKLTHGDMEILSLQHWLHKNWEEGVDLGKMTDEVHMSERTLQRRFTQATGFSPSSYVMKLRLQKAREYLETSRASIDEIVWKIGYEDQSSFRKLFRRETGLTPSEYRKRFSR